VIRLGPLQLLMISSFDTDVCILKGIHGKWHGSSHLSQSYLNRHGHPHQALFQHKIFPAPAPAPLEGMLLIGTGSRTWVSVLVWMQEFLLYSVRKLVRSEILHERGKCAFATFQQMVSCHVHTGEMHLMQLLPPVESPMPPMVTADWASALLGSRYPVDQSSKPHSQRQEAAVSASAVEAAAYWRKQKSEIGAATLTKHSSAPAPGPSRQPPWPLFETPVHGAPDLQPQWKTSHPPAPSLPPAILPHAMPGKAAWAHKVYAPKKVAACRRSGQQKCLVFLANEFIFL
jgi:hypothetical protein